MAELCRVLGAVRPEPGAEPAPPQPGLDRLDDLAAPLRAGGLQVVVRRQGPPAALPAGLAALAMLGWIAAAFAAGAALLRRRDVS